MEYGWSEIEVKCPFCGEVSFVTVKTMDFIDWKNGKVAQKAFPYLSADEREVLISGICPNCWEQMFGVDE